MKDGGPAFPQDVAYLVGEVYNDPRTQGGMSLRDYFAAAALTGLLARGEQEYSSEYSTAGPGGVISGKYIQDTVYRIADALLAAREQSK